VSRTDLPGPPAVTALGPVHQTRDHYIDGMRALSLLVVVMWHWMFTVLVWHHGPHPSNPIRSLPGLWALTWIFQVMPLFFFVGGFAHLKTWASVERDARGGLSFSNVGAFYRRRLRRLLTPAAIYLAVAVVIRVGLGVAYPHVTWFTSGLLVMLCPLWFLYVYVGLVCLCPIAIAGHRRYGARVPVALGVAAIVVDLARFHSHLSWIGWANDLFVWALAHQLGFFYPTLVAGGRRVAASFIAAGLGSLVVLTTLGTYPAAMVGVPHAAYSNTGPPTVCIAALALLQVGIVLALRNRATQWLERPAVRRVSEWAAARSMQIFLWHVLGFTAAYGVLWEIGLRAPQTATGLWWAERPLYLILPAAATAGLLRAANRSTSSSQPDVAPLSSASSTGGAPTAGSAAETR
jgi:peptidoglycan/LPS O-acetylase OafA/YrhL